MFRLHLHRHDTHSNVLKFHFEKLENRTYSTYSPLQRHDTHSNGLKFHFEKLENRTYSIQEILHILQFRDLGGANSRDAVTIILQI